jgi:uncharacterized protein YndB with AHSA1/START domain
MTTMGTKGAAVVTLPTDTEILITRQFDAPKHLVYKAYTTPELVRRWWSGRRGTVTSAEIDLRVGGRWRYVMVANRGFEVAFNGEFREIIPDERIVTTEVYEGAPATPEMANEGVVNIVSFIDVGGRTRMEVLVRCTSKALRDMIIESGMEGGMQEAYDSLEEVAKSLVVAR